MTLIPLEPRKLYKNFPDGLNFNTVDGDDTIIVLLSNPSVTTAEDDENLIATYTLESVSTALLTA